MSDFQALVDVVWIRAMVDSLAVNSLCPAAAGCSVRTAELAAGRVSPQNVKMTYQGEL
jgi:hypothetical protein